MWNMRSKQVGRVLGVVGHGNVLYSFRHCLQHFDRTMVTPKPFDITGVQSEVLTSYVTCNPHQGQEAFCVWEPNCRLGQFCPSLRPPTLSPGVFTLLRCLVVLSFALFSSKTSIWTRWSMFLSIAGISCYLVYYTRTGDVTVDQGLGTAILIQLMVAADYILITDVHRDIYPKDQPPGAKGAEVDMPLMKRFRRALSLYTTHAE